MELAKRENSFDLLYAEAEKLSQADLLPTAYRGKPANVMIAKEMANRLGLTLLEVTQNLTPINGKPSWGSQFIITRVNQSGKYASSIMYDWVGERGENSWGCAAYVITKDKKVLKGATITIDIAKREGWMRNAKWQTIPEQMLMYRAATFFCRTYCPEVLCGCLTQEEAIDIDTIQEAESRFASAEAEPTPPPPAPTQWTQPLKVECAVSNGSDDAVVCDEKPAKELFKDTVKEAVPAGL